LDVRLQWRNKFYYIAAAVTVVSVLIVRQLFPKETIGLILPLFFMTGIGSTSYFLLGGLILFEKSEHTLDAQVVTPLRPTEYLISKVATLTCLGVLEGLILALAGYGLDLHLIPLLVGLSAMLIIYLLTALLVVVRSDSLNQFFVPSIAVLGLLFMPSVLDQLGLWHSPLLYLWPMQGPLLLTRAAFTPISTGQLLYALAACLLVIGFLSVTSYQTFQKYIIRREGGH
jgi:fluoroquinolone transport system permease protein